MLEIQKLKLLILPFHSLQGDPDECECELNALNIKIPEVRRCLGFLWEEK